jgi:adenylyltransferase/sulfurtransferase
MNIDFSKEELERYSRHLIIPEFNVEGQRKLKQSKVLVVGSGGLGAPLLLYLAAAGVGHIGIVDFDVVEDSNLQRQVLFSQKDLGRPKVEAARDRLLGLNPHIEITTYNTHLSSENAMEILEGYDLVADGTDNFPTRYLVNDACVFLGIPNVYASIYRFEGQASVFNYAYADGSRGPNFRDLFPSPPPPGLVPSCAEGGVIGVLPGILGSIQANEVIKVLSGVGDPLAGRLFLFDAATFHTRTLKIRKDPSNPVSGENPSVTKLIDYEAFCGYLPDSEKEEKMNVKEISAKELDNWKKEGKNFQLIDVREPYEYAISNMGGVLIPQGQVEYEVSKIRKDIPVVVHCRSGVRSASAIEILQARHGFENLYNLRGGILAWADEINPELAKY